MKRKSRLFEDMITEENIRVAFYNAKKGKKHYQEVRMVESNPDYYLSEIKNMLQNKTFKTSEYEVFTRISGGKTREIFKLPFYPDRIIHHCIIQVVQDLWIKSLIRDTYSTIPERGIHDGVRRMKKALRDVDGTKYCLKFDISKYYPSVNHDVLKLIIRKKIKDNDMLLVLDDIIDSANGIPIGNYVSQWFGNLYLSYLDHFCKENLKCKHYFRYCDDVVILSDSKELLRSILNNCSRYLDKNLHLTIKQNYQIFPVGVRGIDFLGYRFFHDYTLVRKRIVLAMKKKLKSPKSLASYWGWLKHADAYKLTNKLTNKYFKNDRKFKQSA